MADTKARRPGNKNHLERLIDRWSKDDPEQAATASHLRHLVGVSVVAAMLDGLTIDGDVHLIIRGGAALALRFGVVARGSRDVDALVDIDLQQARELIVDKVEAGWEQFTGSATEPMEVTRAGISPAPIRFKIKLKYRGSAFITIDFELSRAEASSFTDVELVQNAIEVGKVLLPSESVLVLGASYQIAQKLHACTEVPNEGSNQRVHDLYDILVLAEIAETTGLVATRAACEETFSHRAKHDWPPRLPEWPDWAQLWEGLQIPDELRYPYAAARERIDDLIRRIAEA